MVVVFGVLYVITCVFYIGYSINSETLKINKIYNKNIKKLKAKIQTRKQLDKYFEKISQYNSLDNKNSHTVQMSLSQQQYNYFKSDDELDFQYNEMNCKRNYCLWSHWITGRKSRHIILIKLVNKNAYIIDSNDNEYINDFWKSANKKKQLINQIEIFLEKSYSNKYTASIVKLNTNFNYCINDEGGSCFFSSMLINDLIDIFDSVSETSKFLQSLTDREKAIFIHLFSNYYTNQFILIE